MAKLVLVICALIRFAAGGERLDPVAFKKIKAGCSIFDLGIVKSARPHIGGGGSHVWYVRRRIDEQWHIALEGIVSMDIYIVLVYK